MILKRVIKSFYFLHLIIIFLSLSYLNVAVRHIVPEKQTLSFAFFSDFMCHIVCYLHLLIFNNRDQIK